ncbi:MAG: hypothetical protein JXR05_04470 [Flavobacteriaceae bacterium]
MIKFFRKIRQKLLSENKFRRYLIYAIGEIILVVIGILIALQINNNNEVRKNQKNVIENLKTIQQELLLDINKASEVIISYNIKDSLICRVLNSKVTATDYKRNRRCRSLTTSNYLLKIHKNGFEKLESKIDILPEKYDELFEKLNTIYLEEVPIIELRNQLMRNYASSTKENYVKNYEWYIDYSFGKVNDESINYFMNDGFYKNTVARYRELLIDNLLISVQKFRENAIISYNEISNLLSSNIVTPEETKGFNLKNETLEKYTGDYVFPSLGQFTVKVLVVENELHFKYPWQKESIKLNPLSDSYFYIGQTRTVRITQIENGSFEVWTNNNCNSHKGVKIKK